MKLPGATCAAFVRSPHATPDPQIDTSEAKQHPGVVAVYTGEDMTGVNSLPCGWDLRKEKKIPGVVQDRDRPAHAAQQRRGPPRGRSRRGGHRRDPVGGHRCAPRRSGRLGRPEVGDGHRARHQAGAPQVHDGAPGNVAFKWELGDAAATEAAIKARCGNVKKRIINQRLVANAMEPRACVARYDDATGELTLWVTSQNPHVHRLLMCAFVLGIPEHKVRVIAPDVGGGFGSKIFLYNEESSARGRRGCSSGRCGGRRQRREAP